MNYDAEPKTNEGEYISSPKCDDCLRRLCCPCAGGCQYFKVSCNGICTPKKQRNKEAEPSFANQQPNCVEKSSNGDKQ